MRFPGLNPIIRKRLSWLNEMSVLWEPGHETIQHHLPFRGQSTPSACEAFISCGEFTPLRSLSVGTDTLTNA